ncbi:hypothetical protein [Roseateles sp.]|uniref:hypothetical protein n=1 Tax=Roseateles sp. TaxID=1971397 RepID=UPI002DF7E3D2|nr:hypothetical protein [Roseateles sp.]
MSAVQMELPQWLSKAVRKQVLSPAQAWLIFDLQLMSDQDLTVMPPLLDDLMERLFLYERSPANRLPV